ncbi:hypothetical protein N780_15880 [Pontibacillus chungwhensis BH030062]|uniref:Uncharacterized protein n=1 Tax=Pontibacillus chungwhensis BH030062 TaxID=1385513 RepID=A0A0A2UVP6_9BACI|nr:hypothetical protein [Pontibacillus chungwhensis]KGP92004.1 hypothetical protein N780_15880 [Pontibacillus chungwhensis BH030062]
MKRISVTATFTLFILFIIFVMEPQQKKIDTSEKVLNEPTQSPLNEKDLLRTYNEWSEDGVVSYLLEAHEGEKQVLYGGEPTGVTIIPKMTFRIHESKDKWEAEPIEFKVEPGDGVRIVEEEGWKKDHSKTYTYTKSVRIKGEEGVRRLIRVSQAKKLTEEQPVSFNFPTENYDSLQELLEEQDGSKMFHAMYEPGFEMYQEITFTLVNPENVKVQLGS